MQRDRFGEGGNERTQDGMAGSVSSSCKEVLIGESLKLGAPMVLGGALPLSALDGILRYTAGSQNQTQKASLMMEKALASKGNSTCTQQEAKLCGSEPTKLMPIHD